MRQHSAYRFNNHPAFITVLVIFYVVLTAGLIVLRVSFYHNNQAFNNGFNLVSHTRSIIESTDSMTLEAQNLWWESRNYALTTDSNAYRASILIRSSLQKNASRLINLLKDDGEKDSIAQSVEHQIQQLIKLTDS